MVKQPDRVESRGLERQPAATLGPGWLLPADSAKAIACRCSRRPAAARGRKASIEIGQFASAQATTIGPPGCASITSDESRNGTCRSFPSEEGPQRHSEPVSLSKAFCSLRFSPLYIASWEMSPTPDFFMLCVDSTVFGANSIFQSLSPRLGSKPLIY
jgi:hypothetical protein